MSVGAGKSTLISILSGAISQSSGLIEIFGLDTLTDIHHIHSMMGVCPQDNILFDRLTVKEHLNFYAGLKGTEDFISFHNNKEIEKQEDRKKQQKKTKTEKLKKLFRNDWKTS